MDVIIDDRIKYRFGSPLLPVLPVRTVLLNNVEEKVADCTMHLTRIGYILDERGITSRHTGISYRLHEGSIIEDKYLTLVTRAVWKDASNETWPNAVQQIREYLNGLDVHLAIEIIAHPLDQGLRSFPFATDIYHWNDVLMMDTWKFLKGRKWITLDMVYREDVEVRGGKRPTILICARDVDDLGWWVDVLPAVRRRVADTDIQVELLWDHEGGFMDPNSAVCPNVASLQKSMESSEVEIGASCGFGLFTGTLGGPVLLMDKKNGAKYAFGITNHHVLAQTSGRINRSNLINSPSPVDYACIQKQLVDEIISNHTIALGPGSDKSMLRRLARALDFDKTLGKAFASSGFRVAQSKTSEQLKTWFLDWGLVSVKKRVIRSVVETNAPSQSRTVKGHCSFDANRAYRVFKKGRTTGMTEGIITATEAAINGRYSDIPVRCNTIIADMNDGQKRRFAEQGDSGSLILLDPKNCMLSGEDARSVFNAPEKLQSRDEVWIAGLSFGANQKTRLSYMVPMDVTLQDVESVTGMQVLEPRYVGQAKYT